MYHIKVQHFFIYFYRIYLWLKHFSIAYDIRIRYRYPCLIIPYKWWPYVYMEQLACTVLLADKPSTLTPLSIFALIGLRGLLQPPLAWFKTQRIKSVGICFLLLFPFCFVRLRKIAGNNQRNLDITIDVLSLVFFRTKISRK